MARVPFAFIVFGAIFVARAWRARLFVVDVVSFGHEELLFAFLAIAASRVAGAVLADALLQRFVERTRRCMPMALAQLAAVGITLNLASCPRSVVVQRFALVAVGPGSVVLARARVAGRR